MTLHERMGATDDEGFSLVEVIVAMVVFAVMVSAALGILFSTLDVTRDNAHRVAASNLATKQIEAARSQLAINILDGATSRTETVAGTSYTITQNANYIVEGSDTSLCEAAGGQLAHKLVTVEVTWPNMGSVAPVRVDTVKALGVGTEGLDEALGTLAVAVTGAGDRPAAGVIVTLTPGNFTRTTGSDGCAVFVGLNAGAGGTDYTASVSQAGHVGSGNQPSVQVVQGVTSGQVSKANIFYDRSRTLDVQIAAPAGFNPPPGLPVSLRSSYLSGGAVLPPCAVAAPGAGCLDMLPGQARNLFPASYAVWAGECPYAGRPPEELTNVDLVAASSAVTLQLQPVQVRLEDDDDDDGDGSDLGGRAVTATSGCGGTAYALPATSADGTTTTALPPGTWTFSTDDDDFDSDTITIDPAPYDDVIDVELEED